MSTPIMLRNTSITRKADVIVVGAGLSGLQTAVDIQAAGHSCIVVEALERVGGKTLTFKSRNNGPGNNDMGAAWINDTNQSEMYKLLKRFNLNFEFQRATGAVLTQKPDGMVLAHPFGTDAPLSTVEERAVQRATDLLNRLIEQCDVQHPENSAQASELDSNTFLGFFQALAPSEAVADFCHYITRAFLGVEADELSALYMIHYLKCGTGYDNMVKDIKDGGQYMRVREGTQSFAKGLAQELQPGTVVLASPVESIEQSVTGICTVRTKTGAVFQSRKVVISVPSHLYSSIQFSPSLPANKQYFSDRSVMGYYSKMVFVFDQPWWREAGLSGIIDSNHGPLMFTRDSSFAADEQWSITCFCVGEPGRKWSKLPKALRHEQVWSQFCAIFSTAVGSVPDPINVLEYEWSKQGYFLGAPCPVTIPGTLTATPGEPFAPFQDIHFVGTETASVWKGYMEGAVRSGQRGAKEIIKSLEKHNNMRSSL